MCLPMHYFSLSVLQFLIFVFLFSRSRLFDAMLERVSYNKSSTAPSNQRILVLDAGLRDGRVPLCLRQYECFKLRDIGSLCDRYDSCQLGESDEVSFVGIVRDVFHEDIDAILKLFCIMIGQIWPCS